MADRLDPVLRDALVREFRARVYDRLGYVEFPHQAMWRAATEGYALTKTAVDPTDALPPGCARYKVQYTDPTRVPDVTRIRTEWRLAQPRPHGPVHYAASLASYKSLDMDTPIPTPTGYVAMRDVQVGQAVFDEHGHVCYVIGTSPVQMDPSGTYQLTFDDGSMLIASGAHEWWTYSLMERAQVLRATPAYRALARARKRRRSGTGLTHSASVIEAHVSPPTPGVIRTTLDMAGHLRNRYNQTEFAIPVAEAWEIPEAVLPIDPYVLGVWLGDGNSADGYITSADPEILYGVDQAGFPVSKMSSSRYRWKADGLTAALRANGLLKDKHVPECYFWASPAQRLALLQGLLDTDGYATKRGGCQFSNTRRVLADAVWRLASSLGAKPKRTTTRARLNGRDIGPLYEVTWRSTLPSFRLARKAMRCTAASSRQRYRFLRSIVRIPDRPLRCLAVDSQSHLYLAGEMGIPTHNSGKSQEMGIWATGFACIQNALVQLIGVEYKTAEQEFSYLVDALLGANGMRLKKRHLYFDVRNGRLHLELTNGMTFEVKSWERKESLKGHQVTAMLACEAYQLPGLESFTTISQNLRAERGYYAWGSTCDSPWLGELHEMGHGRDPDWACVCGVPGWVNPYTFELRAFLRDCPDISLLQPYYREFPWLIRVTEQHIKGLMTRERFAIAWLGQLGTYAGRVYNYQRGSCLFGPESHPALFQRTADDEALDSAAEVSV